MIISNLYLQRKAAEGSSLLDIDQEYIALIRGIFHKNPMFLGTRWGCLGRVAYINFSKELFTDDSIIISLSVILISPT